MELENTNLEGLEQTEKIDYPYITFRVNGANYCTSSKLVSGMMMIPEVINIPDSPEYVLGIMRYKAGVVPLIDIRVLLGMESLEAQYMSFIGVIETRKNDHIKWVKEFERCVTDEVPFSLATNPRMCAFGKWYYPFRESENTSNTIEMVLNKIEKPHSNLHNVAIGYQENPADRDAAIKAVERANSICYNEILPLLDELKEVFRGLYKSMAIVLEEEDKALGVIVDEVDAIKYFDYETQSEEINNSPDDNYIKSVIKDEDGTLYLEMDPDRMISLTKAIPTETTV